MGVSIREGDYIVGKEATSVNIRTEFDIEVHRFLS